MTTTATAPSATSTGISVAGAIVFQKTDYQGRVIYTLDIASPRDAEKLTELVFSWTEEPEFRVSPEGDPVLPWVRAGVHKPLIFTPKYVQKAAAEAAELIAAHEEDRHRVAPRTPEEADALGSYVTRAQHVEMLSLHKQKLEDFDQELVVAVLRAAVEDCWATPEDLTEVENARDEALGELEEQKPQMEELESLRTSAEAVQEEAWRFLSRFEPTGLRPEGLDAAHCEIVTDEARYLDEALSKLGAVI